jgi:hypothetical protein
MVIGNPTLLFAQLSFSGYTIGTISKATIIARKEILVTALVGLCPTFRIFDIRIDMPIDDSIITEIEPNTSNLTNAELK